MSVATAYDPDLFDAADNITISELGNKTADGVGHGLVGVKDNAEYIVQVFGIMLFFFILLWVIDFGKALFTGWGGKR